MARTVSLEVLVLVGRAELAVVAHVDVEVGRRLIGPVVDRGQAGPVGVFLGYEQRVLCECVVVDGSQGELLIELYSLVEVGIVSACRPLTHPLRNLYTEVIELLHPDELLHVALCLAFAIVDVVDAAEPVIVQLLPVAPYSIAVGLHLDGVLLDEFLD